MVRLPYTSLPHASPPGPPACSLVRPPTHARALQARQKRLPSGPGLAAGAARRAGPVLHPLGAIEAAHRSKPGPQSTLRVARVLKDVALASRLARGDAGTAAVFCDTSSLSSVGCVICVMVARRTACAGHLRLRAPESIS